MADRHNYYARGALRATADLGLTSDLMTQVKTAGIPRNMAQSLHNMAAGPVPVTGSLLQRQERYLHNRVMAHRLGQHAGAAAQVPGKRREAVLAQTAGRERANQARLELGNPTTYIPRNWGDKVIPIGGLE